MSLPIISIEGHRYNNYHEVIADLKKGLDVSEVQMVAEGLGVSLTQLTRTALPITMKSLQRWKKTGSKLPLNISERIFKLKELIAFGTETLGSGDSFKNWLQSSIRSLGYKKPYEMLDTIYGIDLITDELGRISYGVYS